MSDHFMPSSNREKELENLLKKLVTRHEDPMGFYYTVNACWSIPKEWQQEIEKVLQVKKDFSVPQ